MKTYTNKSNAARAAKAANGGTLDGLMLSGTEGAWHYIPTSISMDDPIQKVAATPAPAKSARDGDALAGFFPAGKAPAKAPSKPKAAPVKKAATKAPAKPAKPARAPKPAAPVYDPKTGAKQGRIVGYKIDEDREEKHGVKRRSAGTIGGGLWAIFDAMAKKAGGAVELDISVVKASPEVAEYNSNKVTIEFYYWRRFNGVRGRGTKQKVDA